MENPPGLLSLGGTDVLRDLAEMGFDAEWATLPASAFGATHLRERVFLVADARSEQGEQRYIPDVQRRRTRKAKQAGVGSSITADSNSNHPKARIFRAGGAFTALPFPCCGTDQPGVDRMAHAVPHRMERLVGLGNGVFVPCAKWIGERIMEAEVSR